MNAFITEYKELAAAERKARSPAFLVSLCVVACIPLLYCSIFIESMKDPYGNLSKMPVALVNLDAGTRYQGVDYELGAELSKRLLEQKPVDFIEYRDADEAKSAVRRGELYLALILPGDFSERAMAAESGSKASLVLYESQGGNYFAAHVGQSLADKVADSVNAQLGAARWAAVSAALPRLSEGMGSLRAATDKLAAGSMSLASGCESLSSGAATLSSGLTGAKAGSAAIAAGSAGLAAGVGRLADGVAQLSSGIRQLDAAAPDATRLAPLTDGSVALADGSASLASGLGKLADGVDDASRKAGLLGAGLKQVTPRLREAEKGARQLAAGSKGLADGVANLAAGNGKIKGALDAMSSRLPADADLASLKSGAATVAEKNGELASGVERLSAGAGSLSIGAARLAEGARSLAGGIATIRERLPSAIAGPGGDPEGLASSVAVVEEVAAPVANNGQAFAPYSMSISLWIGMLMASFVFSFASATKGGRRYSRTVVTAQKLAAPALLVIAQAATLYVGILAMGMGYAHGALVLAASIASGLCFLAVIFCLNALLGDAGKLLSVIVLVLQIGAAGGSFPIELSPGFFRAIHAYLPMSDAVTALRFGVAGAYEGQYWASMLRLGITALAFLALALTARPRRERFPEGSERAVEKAVAARGPDGRSLA